MKPTREEQDVRGPSQEDVAALVSSLLNLTPFISHENGAATTLVSHIVLAPSLTPTVHQHITTPPPCSACHSAPVVFLIRPPTSSALQAPVNPRSLLLSHPSAFAATLTLGYNTALASDLGVQPNTALPLFDSSPHRTGQAIGLVGKVDPLEAGRYRFQTRELERTLRRMVGGEAAMVNRVSDVFKLCVGVSEDGAIGVFDFRGVGAANEEAGGDEGSGESSVDRARAKMNGIPEAEENVDEGESVPVQEEVYMGEREYAAPDTPAATNGNDNGSANHDTRSTERSPCAITAVCISKTFDAATVRRAYDLATSAGYLSNKADRLLFITAQPRQAGLLAARQHNMLVMCVTGNAANFWGLRYIGRKIREKWPGVDVREVVKK